MVFALLDDIRMRPKLLLLFLFTAIVPLVVVGSVGGYFAIRTLTQQTERELSALQDMQADKLTAAFNTLQAVLTPLAEAPHVRAAFTSTDLHIEDTLKGTARSLNLMAIALITQKGVVRASSLKELDGHDLTFGRLAASAMSIAWSSAKEQNQPVFVDFSADPLGWGSPLAFLALPVFDAEGGRLGVLLALLGPDFVDQPLASRQGLGKTGETYAIRFLADGNRYEFRSSMRTMGMGRYRPGVTLDRPPAYWGQATHQESGFGEYIDSSGTTVFVAFRPIDILGVRWFLISKIDKAEVFQPIVWFTLAMMGAAVFFVLAITPGVHVLARRLSAPLEAGVRFAQAISSGNYTARWEVSQHDEMGDLAHALNRMAQDLREQDWRRRGISGLDNALRGEHTPEEILRRALDFLSRHTEASLGLAYLAEENGALSLRASRAFVDRTGTFHRVEPGHGLVGQAVQEGELLTFHCLKDAEQAPTFSSGVHEAIPSHLAALPLVFEGRTVGALLFGMEAPITHLMRDFLTQAGQNLAVLLHAALSRQTIDGLLRTAQEQQEQLRQANQELEAQARALKESEAELQAQHEELQVTNEELEEQARALKESQTKLEAQQEELRAANAKLEERTNALEEQKIAMRKKNIDLLRAQEQLRQKAEELEQANRYKSEFLANMSHELRTPLNSILILSQLLAANKDGNLTARQQESAQAIHASGSDLLRLINDILDLSKVEAGKIEVHEEPLALDALVADLLRLFTSIAEDKHVRFVVEREDDLPDTILTDGLRLQQILRNLLSNAFKFTDKGTVTLRLFRPAPDQVPEHLGAQRLLAMAVQDTGIGIPKDKHATVFEPFRQADGSTTRKYGGTGLGLSISRELARLLGGDITLESEPGKGTTFTLFLLEKPVPAASANPLPQQATAAAASADPGTTATPDPNAEAATTLAPPMPAADPACPEPQDFVQDDRRSLQPGDTIMLIIDDHLERARRIRDRARTQGFATLLAHDAETGLHFADYHRPQAIVLAGSLPSSWKTLERLKADVGTRAIPLVFLTTAERGMEALRLGAYTVAPEDPDAAAIDAVLQEVRAYLTSPRRRVLIVDDDRLQRESLASLIATLPDVEISTCGTSAEALDILRRTPVHCLILDLGLPDASGFDLLRRIRADESLSHTPIIVYTGRDLSADEETLLSRHAESIIVKGVRSPERLLEETALYLHRKPPASPQTPEGEVDSVFAGKTVLLVDDDMRNVFALSSVLEDKGLTVLVARDGQEGLARLEEHAQEVDLVLMDIMMPVMNGFEAMAAIRAQKRFRDLPIIALTAKAMKGDRAKCIEAGASDYLAKPVDTEKLVSLLKVWLSQ
ncbi:MAG: response regulator [Desulfomicrobiaceae bacterium]